MIASAEHVCLVWTLLPYDQDIFDEQIFELHFRSSDSAADQVAR